MLLSSGQKVARALVKMRLIEMKCLCTCVVYGWFCILVMSADRIDLFGSVGSRVVARCVTWISLTEHLQRERGFAQRVQHC